MARNKAGNGIVLRYGKLWTRVPENLKQLASKDLRNTTGVYALYNGTMPVYIGKGIFSNQIKKHNRNNRKSPYWEHFSWYEIKGEGLDKEIESLLLRIFPFYVRSLNRMAGNFESGTRIRARSRGPIKDLWPKGGPGKKRHRKWRVRRN
jgi:hypothetical protein